MNNCLICSNKTKTKRNNFCSKECELIFRKKQGIGWHKWSRPVANGSNK